MGDESGGGGDVVAEPDPHRLAAVSGDRHPRTAAGNHAVCVEAETDEGTRARRLDHDVRSIDEFGQFSALPVVLGVENDGLVATVQEAIELGVAASCSVRTARSLDLHHAGTGQAEQVRAQRPGPQGTEVDDEQTTDRSGLERSGWCARGWRDGPGRNSEEFGALREFCARVLGEPLGDRGPRIVTHVGADERAQEQWVAGACARHRRPPVGGGKQPARTSHGCGARPVHSGEGGTLGEQAGAIEPYGIVGGGCDPCSEFPGPGRCATRRNEGWSVESARQRGYSALRPVAGWVVGATGGHARDATFLRTEQGWSARAEHMDTANAVTISPADLVDGAADAPLVDGDGAVGKPVMIVRLDDSPEAVLARAAHRATLSDRVLVGLATTPIRDSADSYGPLLEALDVTYASPDPQRKTTVGSTDPDADAAAFAAAVTRNPLASLTARHVLRATETLAVAQAIDVESLGYSTLQGGPEFARWLEDRGTRPLPPAAGEDPVLLTRDGDALHLTLNRPERRNAYGTQLRDALVEALQLVLLDESLTHVVLDGAGPSFCAGGDLDEFGRTPDTATAHLIRTRGGAGRLVARLADRLEVRLHGHCVGAGIEIPAFAGRVVAHPDTIFRLPEVAMGLIPGAGGTVSIPRRIGRWRAMHLFVTATPLTAERALDWGLVDEIRATAPQRTG